MDEDKQIEPSLQGHQWGHEQGFSLPGPRLPPGDRPGGSHCPCPGAGRPGSICLCAPLLPGFPDHFLGYLFSRGVPSLQRTIPDPQSDGERLGVVFAVRRLAGPSVGAAFVWWKDSAAWVPYAAVTSILVLLVACFNGLFLGASDMRGVNIIQFAASFFFLVLSTLFLLGLRMGLRGALGAWVGSDALALVWIWNRSGVRLSQAGQARIEGHTMNSLLLFTFRVGGANTLSFLNYRVDAFMVKRLIGFQALGIYTIAVAVWEMLWVVSRAVTTACYGRLGRGSENEASQLASRAMRQTAAALIVGAAGMAIAGVLLIPAFFGSAFPGAVPALLVLLPGNMVFGVGSILAAYFTNHKGRPEISIVLAGLSALTSFIFCLLLIPRFGLLGAALASSISYIVSIAVGYAWFIRVAHVSWRDVVVFRKSDWTSNVRLLRAMVGRDP